MNDLTDRAALVTGGSRGIGAATVRALAAAGADVAFTYRVAAAAADRVLEHPDLRDRRSLALRADGTDPDAGVDAVRRTVEELGGLDILVHNAGTFPYGPVDDVTRDELDDTLALQLRGLFTTTQAALPHLDAGGRIIIIGSCFAQRVPVPGVALYAMTKAALVGLTRGLARDLGPRGITVNIVHPGPTDTDMNPADGEDADGERALTALGRYGRAEDVAASVLHLAGAGGAAITGSELSVDGGYAA